MLREQVNLFRRLVILADIVVLAASLWLAYYFTVISGVYLDSFLAYAWSFIVIVPLWLFLLHHNQLYSSFRRLTQLDIFLKLLKSQITATLMLGFIIWFISGSQFSRTFFLFFIVISFVLLFAQRFSLRKFLGFFYTTRNLLIVGTQEKAQHFLRLVEDHKDWGLEVIGFLQADESVPLKEEVAGFKVYDYASSLIDICNEKPVDEVVFCLPKNLVIDAESYFQDLKELGITVRMVIDFYDIKFSRKELSLFHDELPILTFHSKEFNAQQLMIKRLLDITGAVVGMLLTLLLFPLIALAIKRDSPGQLFFGQKRVGLSGRTFTCWKFRTMYIDAEERKKALMGQNEMRGAMFKIKNDPRITRVGHFLRKASLDELPQFWNVLKGEMSLVGTRPPTLDEVALYENWHRRRISIKPGITGKWQVNGRNRIDDFDEVVRLDLDYIDHWSIWLDIKILLKTVQVVFIREGSC